MNDYNVKFLEWIIKNMDFLSKRFSTLDLSKDSNMDISTYSSYKNEVIRFLTVAGINPSTVMENNDFQKIVIYTYIMNIYNNNLYNTPFTQLDKLKIDFELSILIKKIKNNFRKSKIVAKHYNYLTLKYEYELEDGNFIEVESPSNPKNFRVSMDNVFPREFLAIFDKSLHREIIIDKII